MKNSIAICCFLLCSSGIKGWSDDNHQLVKDLGHPKYAVRQKAMDELQRRPSLETIKLLEAVTSSNDAEASTRAVSVLRNFLERADENIRVAAKQSLGRIGQLPLPPSKAKVMRWNRPRRAPRPLPPEKETLESLEKLVRRNADGQIVELMYDCTPPKTLAGAAEVLGGFKELKTLYLGNCSNKQDLEVIANCTNLEELNLLKSGFSDEDVAQLISLKKLRKLEFWWCPELTGDSLLSIRKLPSLAYLNLSRGQFSGCVHLRNAISIETLSGDASLLKDFDLSSIAAMPSLQEVVLLNAIAIGDPGLVRLADRSSLERIIIADCLITDGGMRALSKLKLKSLNISGKAVTDECLKNIVDQASLVELSLPGMAIKGNGLEQLPKLANLESLNLNFTNVGDSSIPALAACPKLKRVGLLKSKVSPKGLISLCESKAIEEINLVGTILTADGVRHDLPLKQLK